MNHNELQPVNPIMEEESIQQEEPNVDIAHPMETERTASNAESTEGLIVEDLSSDGEEMPPLVSLDSDNDNDDDEEEATLDEDDHADDAEEDSNDNQEPDLGSFAPLFTLRVTYEVPNTASPSDPESSTQSSNQTQHIDVVFVVSPFNDTRSRAAARAAADVARAQGDTQPQETSPFNTRSRASPIPPEVLLRLLISSGVLGSGAMPTSTTSGHFGMPNAGFDLEDFMNRAFLQYQQGVRSAPPTKLAVNSLDQYVVEDGAATDNCTICQEDFVSGDNATKLPCTHAYHSDCVLQWLKDHHTCPVCRHALPTEETTVVH
eukprot:TRINITY_DN1223_c0_g1_i1.p1 TRINITY_DN1223_c0_g1~~TRINITY_DN1223_c0_g1_i1.p1  ORF type:complete len:319 (-),score=62.49 TRINITY_DN1223_c0_g1_i1:203-1159(-)